MGIILSFLMILGLAAPAPASAQSSYVDPLAMYASNPFRWAGTTDKYCLADSGEILTGFCTFNDVDSCVKAARNLGRIKLGVSCKPNRYYQPSDKE